MWLLNDALETVSDTVTAEAVIGDKVYPLTVWETGEVGANSNIKGESVSFLVPESNSESLILRLISAKGNSSEYKLKLMH